STRRSAKVACGARAEPVAADQGAGQQQERKPPRRVPIPADLEPPVATQPGQRPLHPPPLASNRCDDSLPRRAILVWIPRLKPPNRSALRVFWWPQEVICLP